DARTRARGVAAARRVIGAGAAGAEVRARRALLVEGQEGFLSWRRGDPRTADERFSLALAHARRVGGPDVAIVLLNRGSLLLELGDVERARVDLSEAVEKAEAAGDVLLVSKARHNLGYVEYLRGD